MHQSNSSTLIYFSAIDLLWFEPQFDQGLTSTQKRRFQKTSKFPHFLKHFKESLTTIEYFDLYLLSFLTSQQPQGGIYMNIFRNIKACVEREYPINDDDVMIFC